MPRSKIKIHVIPGAFLFAALLLLILPVRWLAAAFFSAMVHELSHILMIRGLGVRIDSISVGIGRAQIKTEQMTDFQEMLCALAGPVGGLCLLVTAKWLPRVAICTAFQSIYNLIPIYPNDGGRVIYCLARLLMPAKAANYMFCCVEWAIALFSILAGIYGTFCLHLGALPLVISWMLVIRTLKTPCKPNELKVQ